MASSFRLYIKLIKTLPRLGLHRVAFIAWYRWSLRTGFRERRFPAMPTPGHEAINADFSADRIEYLFHSKSLFQEADKLLAGQVKFFNAHFLKTGSPPDWHRNSATGNSVKNADQHWTRIDDFTSGAGDIKWVWEPSRFIWAPVLARAYRVTGNQDYLHTLQEWVADWLEHNPVNIGPNWKCGQETSLRLLNLILAIRLINGSPGDGLPSSKDDLPWTRNWLRFLVAEHLRRIKANHGYARVQQNNHATSEAAGMYAGGLFLLHTLGDERGRNYVDKGRKLLERYSRKLIAKDGTFRQHSLVYHRLVLDTFSLVLIANRDYSDRPFSSKLKDRLHRAVDWLYLMTDPSGYGPNMGPNDGTDLLRLTRCDHRDYRPSLDLAGYLLDGRRVEGAGPWREAVFWIGGSARRRDMHGSFPNRTSRVFSDGGYVRMQGKESWAVLRLANKWNERPAHADALHFDFWFRGRNELPDAGSYLYNNPDAEWQYYFNSTRAHNTVMVNDRDQMEMFSRFLWVDWVKARLRKWHHDDELDLDIVEADHNGYGNGERGVLHRRAVIRHGDQWAIVDDLNSTRVNNYTLRWRIEPASSSSETNGHPATPKQDVEISISGTAAAIEEGVANSERESYYYGEWHGVACLRCDAEGPGARFVTRLGAGAALADYDTEKNILVFADNIAVQLLPRTIGKPQLELLT